VALDQAAPGTEVDVPGIGHGYRVVTDVERIQDAGGVGRLLRECVEDNGSPLCVRLADVCDPAAIAPEDIVFMDLETTGLGNSPLFLVGAMLWRGSRFEAHQFFARDYSEERAVIALFLEILHAHKLLVTFNGKSFDLPYLRARAAVNGMACPADPHHFDLLHVCRRIWRRRLPDCRLQTLESLICRRDRHGDIPGSEIPEVYHEYVRSNDAWQMVAVLEHNRLDLVTMADLMCRLPPPEDHG
jgi:uncharacterized protein YprB with RNaseH-like and TPR domain